MDTMFIRLLSTRPFTIDDINSAANGGDLQVTIKEADGSIQTLYVPYSSVPVLNVLDIRVMRLPWGNIVVEITCKAPPSSYKVV